MPDKIPRANCELNKIFLVGIKDMSKARDTESLSDTEKKTKTYLVAVGCSTGAGEQQGEGGTL